MKDLHVLPKFRDSWSFLYVEHCRVDQDQKAIAIQDAQGTVPVPCACLALLMLGPGTTITHAAIRTLAEHGCTVLWTGEEGVRLYAQGLGETRKASNLLQQARLWADSALHEQVVRRMYTMRFAEDLPDELDLRQIRGREGVRVRDAYAAASRRTGIPWHGRSYDRSEWYEADSVNRALSAANSCLYGVCHAAILSAGYSPGLGFIHTGKQLSFVYDVADLYKVEVSIPAAFEAVHDNPDEMDLERTVRLRLRNLFHELRILPRIVDDLKHLFDVGTGKWREELGDFDTDEALPGGLWVPRGEDVLGGVNYAESEIATEESGKE